MPPQGLKPHNRQQRRAIIKKLVPLWQHKFGDELLAIAARASYARGDDQPYSDLELVVFLRQLPPAGEDVYLQRIVDGLLIEAVYETEASYLAKHQTLSQDWYLAGSETLLPVYHPDFVKTIRAKLAAVQHPPQAFIRQAAHRFLDVQEACGKVLNAIDQGNRPALPLLLHDAVFNMLVTLSFLNRTPFITFAAFVQQARRFDSKPEHFDRFLDVVASGAYQDFLALRTLILEIFAGFEDLFAGQGYTLYDREIDPNVPNKRYR